MARTILLVEDDLAIAAMLRIALERWGYEVLHAPGSRSAVEVAKGRRQDIRVVLCDVVLPDGPGPEALARIRRHSPRAQVVFTSGYPFDVLAERGLISIELLQQLKALYLPKPFLPHDVHVLLTAALREYEADKERAAVGFSFEPREAYVGIAH
jgi:two-component system alkaline phosphatase synthesis response regulator PhoP